MLFSFSAFADEKSENPFEGFSVGGTSESGGVSSGGEDDGWLEDMISFKFVEDIGTGNNQYSGGSTEMQVVAGDDPKEMMMSVLKGIVEIVAAAGAVIMTLGLGRLAMAFKDDNAGEKSNAINNLVAGALVLTLSQIINAFANISLG